MDKNTSDGTKLQADSTKRRCFVDVGLIEQIIMNYSAVPPEFGVPGNEWRNYRIEYGGHAESCFMERVIYLPRLSDPYVIELLFEFWQSKKGRRKKILHTIIEELTRGL